MPSRWDAATHGWSRRVFHYPLPTLMSRNFRLPCTIELQPVSLTLLKCVKSSPRASPRLCARISAGLRHWRLQADQPCYGMSPCSIEGWQQEHSNAHRTQSVALSPLLLDRWRDSGLAVFPGRAIFGWKICWQVLRRGAVWRYTPSRSYRCWLLTCPGGPISFPTVARL